MAMTEEQFQVWANHPVNKPFRKYLADYRRTLADSWANGESVTEREQAMAFVLGELLNLEWRNVAEFYEIPYEENDDDKSVGDQPG